MLLDVVVTIVVGGEYPDIEVARLRQHNANKSELGETYKRYLSWLHSNCPPPKEVNTVRL